MKNTRHAQHFSRALQYLQNHYTDDIDLHRIAEEAGLSAWHWHRLYRDVMGETLYTTVKWMRLHRAAWLIAYTDKPVADIARECGYRNAQSFARSFRDEYGLSPQQYRARPQPRYPVHIENRAAVAVYHACSLRRMSAPRRQFLPLGRPAESARHKHPRTPQL